MNGIFSLLDEYRVYEADRAMANIALADGLVEVRRSSPHRNPYGLNIMEHFYAEEPKTSWVLGSILAYRNVGDPVVVRSFLAEFLADAAGFAVDRVRNPRVTIEKDHHIDVLIRDSGYAVIVENKLKNAVYQRNQLGRYIRAMTDKGYCEKDIYIVLLPQHAPSADYKDICVRRSAWCCPPDFDGPIQKIRCRHKDAYQCRCDDPEYEWTDKCRAECGPCRNYKDSVCFRQTVVVHKELSAWLKRLVADGIVPAMELPLRSAMLQFADYIDGLYNNRDNDKLKAEMKDFLREKLLQRGGDTYEERRETLRTNRDIIAKKITEVEDLSAKLKELRADLAGETIDLWHDRLKKDWPNLCRRKGLDFGILLKHDVWCGCWFSDNNGLKPYWGFKMKSGECTTDAVEMVDAIIKRVEEESGEVLKKTDKNRNTGWIYWYNTGHGDERCARFYEAARDLDCM